MAKSVEEKRKFIHDNKLCFACLRKGHNSRDCRNKPMCRNHPTSLHEDRPSVDKSPAQGALHIEGHASSLSCCVNGGENGSTSMIVPVWISLPNTTEPEFSSASLIDLPPAYIRDFIPLERAHISTCAMANEWNHLAAIVHEIPP